MTRQDLNNARDNQLAKIRSIIAKHGDGVRPSYVSADLAACRQMITFIDQQLAELA